MTEPQKHAYSLTTLLSGVRNQPGVRAARLDRARPGLNPDDEVHIDVISVEISLPTRFPERQSAVVEYFQKEKARLGLKLVDLRIENYRPAPDPQL